MSLRSTFNLPREHGAWAMLYVPFVLGVMVAGGLGWAGVLLLLATTALFISRESLQISWRARRRGRRSETSLAAGRLLIGYLLMAAAAGAPLILIYEKYLLLPMAFAGAALLVINGWQATELEDRTVQGEVLAIVGLTMTAPAAYYVAGSAFDRTAFWLWALSAAYFASSVFYVKLRVTSIHAKTLNDRLSARRQCIGYHAFLLVSLIALALTGSLPLFALIAFAPVLGRTLWSLIKPAPKLDLKRIGIAEIIYSLIFLVFAALTLNTA